MGRQKGRQPLVKERKSTEMVAEGNESLSISNGDAAGGATTTTLPPATNSLSSPPDPLAEFEKNQNSTETNVDSAGDQSLLPGVAEFLSSPPHPLADLEKQQNTEKSVDSPEDHAPPPPAADSLSSPADPLPPSVESLHPPLVDEYIDDIFSKVSRSIVTVAAVPCSNAHAYQTEFGTGFILLATPNYALIFTSTQCLEKEWECEVRFEVYFENGQVKAQASKLGVGDEKFCILIAQTAKQYPCVVFSEKELDYEPVFVVGAMAGTKLRHDTPIIGSLVGPLGIYRGAVTTPDCYALDHKNVHVKQSEWYFQLTCCCQDKIVRLEEVDKKDHTSHIIEAAPVFRLDGESVGLIYSSGVWHDTKTGLLAHYVFDRIRRSMLKCNASQWKEKLKERAESWLIVSQTHTPTG